MVTFLRKLAVCSTSLVLALVFTTTSALAAGATLSLSPSSGALLRDQNFSLSVNVDTGGFQTDGTDAVLYYDPTKFSALGIRNGSFYPTYPGNNIDPVSGKITITGLSPLSSAISGSGTLATIDFKALGNAPRGTTQVNFDFDPSNKTKTTDSNVVERSTLLDVLNQVVNGTYIISARTASLSLSPSTGTFNKRCTFSLNVNLDTGGSLTDGTDAVLYYDPRQLKVLGIRNSNLYPVYPGNSSDPASGKIVVTGLSSIASAFSGSGTLATVDFKVLDKAPAGSTEVRFDFDPSNKSKTTDSNVVERNTLFDVLNEVSNGNYIIGKKSCPK